MKKYLITVCCLFIVGCGVSKFNVIITKPAEINLSGYRRIAVGKFIGEKGDIFADELTEALFQSGRFEVLDRQHIDKIIEEHKLALGGVVDEATAVELGKFIGAACLIFGNVSLYKYDEEVTYRDLQDTWQDKRVFWRRHYTRRGIAKIGVSFKIVDVQTGKIIAIRRIERAETGITSAIDEQPRLIDKEFLFAQNRKEIINSFMKVIVPYEETVKVRLFTDKKMPKLNEGVNLAKIGKWKEAIEKFKEAIRIHSQDPKVRLDKAYFNLAVAYKYSHMFKEAKEAINKAISIKPQELYFKQLNDIEKQEKQYKKLQEQLRQF